MSYTIRTKPIWMPFKRICYQMLPEFTRSVIPYRGFARIFHIPSIWGYGFINMHYGSNKLKWKIQSKAYYHKYRRYNGSHK